MGSINKVILVGNIGAEPVLTELKEGRCKLSFNLATSITHKNKQTGEKVEKTTWHRVVVWGNLARTCSNILKKGSKCGVEGKNTTETYEKDGQKKFFTQVEANNVQFL